MTSRTRILSLAGAAWFLYGLGTYLAVLPQVPPGGYDRMAVLKLVRTGVGFGIGVLLILVLRHVRRSHGNSGAIGVIMAFMVVVAGYGWLALYHGLTAGLRGPEFFPLDPATLPRLGINYVVVLLAWTVGVNMWVGWEGEGVPRVEGMDSGGDVAVPDTGSLSGDVDAGPLAERKRLDVDDHVYLRLDSSMELLRVSDIHAILADGDYTTVVRDGEGDGLSDRSMREWEAALPTRAFARIHRSVIVNLASIARMEDRPNGGKRVFLRGGRSVSMSRRYESLLRKQLS